MRSRSFVAERSGRRWSAEVRSRNFVAERSGRWLRGQAVGSRGGGLVWMYFSDIPNFGLVWLVVLWSKVQESCRGCVAFEGKR